MFHESLALIYWTWESLTACNAANLSFVMLLLWVKSRLLLRQSRFDHFFSDDSHRNLISRVEKISYPKLSSIWTLYTTSSRYFHTGCCSLGFHSHKIEFYAREILKLTKNSLAILRARAILINFSFTNYWFSFNFFAHEPISSSTCFTLCSNVRSLLWCSSPQN